MNLPTPTREPSPAGSHALWDALVIGAGPAGSLTARGLAMRGARVLLVDKTTFPRWKVCGCCLNGAALSTLTEVGLADLAQRLGAIPLARVKLASAGRFAALELPAGVALSRERFDDALVSEAVAAGATFRPQARATWLEETPTGVRVRLSASDGDTDVEAPVVIAADGLAAGFTRHIPGLQVQAARDARIGVGTVVEARGAAYAPGAIHMAVGSGGYVGLVRLEDHRLDIAAALDVAFVREAGGLPQAATAILQASGLPAIESLDTATWQGTPPLTRGHRLLATNRVLLVGDAAEYVEPFTGEGMAWALASGRAVVPFALDVLTQGPRDTQRQWQRHHRRLLGPRRRRCRALARFLRHPRFVAAAIRLLARMPAVAAPYVRHLNRVSAVPD